MINGEIYYTKCLLKILFILSLLHNANNSYSEVRLFIQGDGERNFLSQYFDGGTSSEVLVNGKKNDTCSKSCYFQGDKNNITLIFNDEIRSCYKMLYCLDDVVEIDFSNCDFSKVETFELMFYSCDN